MASPNTMTSRERVIRSLCHQTPDRVPMNYHADGNFSKQLRARFGLQGNQARNCWLTGNEDPRLLEALGCDLRMLVPDYVGPEIKTNPDGSFTSVFGEHLLIRENEIGAAFFEYPFLPLADAKSVEQVNAHPWPKAEWFDFACIKDQLDQWDEYAIIGGDMGTLDCMNRCLTLFGYERVMIGMAERDPVILTAFERIITFYNEYLKRLTDAAGDRIDIIWLGEDLGTQKGPRISASMFRELIRPLWESVLRDIHSRGYFVMQHSCGSTRAFYPDFIEMGID
ncbi:MAG TPA: uroporphyrinogen decarboxylase family protein, partial [bacterium]|nr:uroporphyrinogen decarboxylase family protein [bacterium]